MIKDWIRFEKIEKDKNGYLIEYNPVFTGDSFAILNITFYEYFKPEKAIEIIENEFKIWTTKYPTPLMVFSENESQNPIDYQKITNNNYLIGYPLKNNKFKMVWGEIDENEFAQFDLSKESLFALYSGLNYKTLADVKKEQKDKANGLKIFRFSMVLWFCVIPGLIAIFGWANPIVSVIALLYSLYMASQKMLKILGKKNKSEKEKEKEKKDMLKRHHHYHCMLNPQGFERLKLENFEKQHKENLQQKIESLSS